MHGLGLRTATPADAEKLAAFNAEIHQGEQYRAWTLDLVGGGHPTVEADDVFLVTDGDAIVASLLLIPQRWTYDGVEVGVGQVEFVGTHPHHRRKGLVRELMAAAHARAAERGLPMQVIGGIPWFYRQFGYAYALDLWVGRQAWRPQLAALEPAEGLRIRPASEADAPRIAAIAATGWNRYLLTHPRDQALWGYELTGRREGSDRRYAVEVLEAGGEVAGVLARTATAGDGMTGLVACEVAPGVSWLDAGPTVLRHCHDAAIEADGAYRAVLAGLGSAHPLYDACPDVLTEPCDWASWYVRVPDLVELLRALAPALDRRLANSVAVGWSGDVRVSWYRAGLRLVVRSGRVTAIEPMRDVGGAGAELPYDQLLQLVFGFRDLDTLLREHYDCTAADRRARAVLAACFPRRASCVWALG